MSLTQHNSDITPAGTTVAGKGGQPCSSSISAYLSNFSKSTAQCSDAWGTYTSEYDREVAKLKREGRIK